jgi:hypothetical protein
MSIWLAAAASLVLGIVIGFASGYRAGQGQPPDPAAGASGQPFSESPVDAPVRLEEEQMVPAPDAFEKPAAAPAQPSPAAPPRVAPPRARATAPAAPGSAAPAEPVAVGGPGSLQVLSRPAGAQVILDGRSVGKTPVTIPELASGPHEVRLELPGFNRWATTVDVKSGNATRVAASLEQ